MERTKKMTLTFILILITAICVVCTLSFATAKKAFAYEEKLVDISATTVDRCSYSAVSVDATTDGKLGGGLLISGTLANYEIPFSIADFKSLTVGADPYFASVFGYDYENEITPFFTLVVDSSYITAYEYNTLHLDVAGSDGANIGDFHLSIRRSGSVVPPYFLKDYNFPLDDDYAEQYVIRAFVDYANGKLYYCTGLELGAGTARNLSDFCTVIDYDFANSEVFSDGNGSIKFTIENGWTGSNTTVTVNSWLKDLCGERNFNAKIKYDSALVGSYGDTLVVPDATISFLGEDIVADKTVTAPNGNPAVIGSEIDSYGNYVVRYSIKVGNTVYYKDSVLRIVEPEFVNIANNAVYEPISIDQTTGEKFGSAYNVSDKAYIFPFSMETFRSLSVPTDRLNSLVNAENRDSVDFPSLVPLATIILGGTGFNTPTQGVDVKIGTDLSNGNIEELNFIFRAAAGGTTVPGLLFDSGYPVDDGFGEQKTIRIYADYVNGKICVTCGIAIDCDERFIYLNTFDYDFSATGLFEGEVGFITVECFDYVYMRHADDCVVYVKNICGVEEQLTPLMVDPIGISICPDKVTLPNANIVFLGENLRVDGVLLDSAHNEINVKTEDLAEGNYTVRYGLTRGIYVFGKEYKVNVKHVFSAMVIGRSATCTEKGIKDYKTCLICGKDFDESGNEISDIRIPALGHSFGEIIAEVPATCTENGVKEHKVCATCGKNFDADGNEITEMEIPALGHSFGEIIAEVPATCTENGVKEHKVCATCGKNFDADGDEITEIEIPALEHTFGEIIVGTPATCTEKGIKDYKTCSVCGKNFDADGNEITEIEIPALGHAFGEIIAEVPATVTEKGIKAHKDCTVCGKHFDADGNELSDITIPTIDDGGNTLDNKGCGCGSAINDSLTVVLPLCAIAVVVLLLVNRKKRI